MNFASRWLCAIAILVCSAQLVQAQVISSAEIERGLSYTGPISEGYVPLSHRYSYGTGPYLYFNGSAQQLRYLDYLDRADRAQKFGYRMPADPFQESPTAVQHYPAVRGYISGGGFGFLKRR